VLARNRTILVAVVLAAGISIAWRITPPIFDLDDAYISLHSARTLLTGVDHVYGAPAFTGATSPLYVAALSLLLRCHLAALRVAAVLGLVTFAAGIFRLARTVGASPVRSGMLVVLTLVSGFVLVNATNGLETGWALAAATWLLVFAVKGSVSRVAVLAGVIPLLRPDLVPFAALVWISVVAQRRSIKAVGLACAISIAVAVPFLVWVRVDTGAWIPQTMQAKAAWFAEACNPWPAKLSVASEAIRRLFGPEQLLVFIVAIVPLVRTRLGRIGLLSCVTTLLVYATVFPGALFHNYYRYTYAIVLPWLIYGGAELLAQMPVSRAWDGLVVLIVTIVAATSPNSKTAPIRRQTAIDLIGSAEWIQAHTDPGTKLMVHDAGAISEFASHPAVDMVGLKSPSSIPINERWTRGSCGRDRAEGVATIARMSRADYLIVTPEWNNLFRLSTGLRERGFDIDLLWTSPNQTYQIYRIKNRSAPG
jgi:hypothetical protein